MGLLGWKSALEKRVDAARAAYLAAIEHEPGEVGRNLRSQTNAQGEMTVGGLVLIERAKLAVEATRLTYEHASGELNGRRADRVQLLTLLVAVAALVVSAVSAFRPQAPSPPTVDLEALRHLCPQTDASVP
jgi:hypothetical protein